MAKVTGELIRLQGEQLQARTIDAERAAELAAELATKAPIAIKMIKRALNDGVDGDLTAGLAIEREAVIEALGTADAEEGVAAFLEKLAPTLTDRQHRKVDKRLGKLRRELAVLLPANHLPEKQMAAYSTCPYAPT